MGGLSGGMILLYDTITIIIITCTDYARFLFLVLSTQQKHNSCTQSSYRPSLNKNGV